MQLDFSLQLFRLKENGHKGINGFGFGFRLPYHRGDLASVANPGFIGPKAYTILRPHFFKRIQDDQFTIRHESEHLSRISNQIKHKLLNADDYYKHHKI